MKDKEESDEDSGHDDMLKDELDEENDLFEYGPTEEALSEDER